MAACRFCLTWTAPWGFSNSNLVPLNPYQTSRI
nr:MAG TPA: hypothetical protein [Caudoviricetes sp.]